MTRVLIVIGIRLYRESLAQLLNERGGFTIVATEPTGADAIRRLDETAPDVALVDIGLRDLESIVGVVSQRSPRTPLVAIGISELETDVLACAEMGITGYVTRDESLDELAAALRGAAEGELICSPRTAGTLFRRIAELAAERQGGHPAGLLTRREYEIAKLMCEDLSNKEIAVRLRIEVATVKNHVHNVLDKLRVRRRAEAARLIAHGRADR